MLPAELKPELFSEYPPEARQIAVAHIGLLQQLPLAFLPLLLREVISYDWKFPAERKELDQQLSYLASLSGEQLQREMQPFTKLRLSNELERVNWVNTPEQFSEQLSAHLWATHQLDAFRTASIDYVHRLNTASSNVAGALPASRLGLVIIGEGVTENRYRLFRKLRAQGVCFTNVQAANGRKIVFDFVAERARKYPVPFGHWYIDGAHNEGFATGLTCISYDALEGVRSALVAKMRKVMQPGGGGPEVLRSMLARMRPEDLGFDGAGESAVLNRFQVSVLTEGSGTQFLSTTFVQWSAREVLRRAQPVTLLVRFAPRQREQSMRELLAGAGQKPGLDPAGSLIDADMGAYYTWINQQRLAGAEQASFLIWFEGHNQALAIGSAFGRGRESGEPTDLQDLLKRVAV